MAKVFDFPFRTVAEVNLQALVKNISSLRTIAEKEVIPVIKADAYGHGMLPVCKVILNRSGCEAVAVATLEEAIELRNQFHRPFTILVLSGFLPHQVEAYERYNLVPIIHSLNHLKSLQGRNRLPAIHLKLDTGMNRLGLKHAEMSEAIRVLQTFPDKLSGFATHLADSEQLASNFVDEQVAQFEHWYRELQSQRLLQTDARIHFANTGAILRKKVAFSTAVRPGVSVYGVLPAEHTPDEGHLAPVLQWKSRVLAFKDVEAGECVGYGRTFRAEKAMRLAVVPVGYADGYPRLLSNRGEVLVNGRRASVIGRVSMDLSVVDVTSIEGVNEGTLVTLIGRDGKDSISAAQVANWADTISYEILCGISKRVPRIYFDSEAT